MRAALTLVLLTLVACGGSDNRPAPVNFQEPPPLWNEYTVDYLTTLNLAESVSLEFTMVEEDTRCPPTTQCVSPGNARILLTYFTPRGTGTVELNTNTSLPISALFDYYGVELRKLDPLPAVVGTPIAPSSYRARLFVVKAATPPG